MVLPYIKRKYVNQVAHDDKLKLEHMIYLMLNLSIIFKIKLNEQS